MLLEAELAPDDGFALAATARALRPGLGIVFLTGRPDRLVGRKPGPGEAFLVKPCPTERVAVALRKVMADGSGGRT